jgi:hypothetical protein
VPRQEKRGIAAWALKLVDRFDSYTEVSPSGEGLHIICKLTSPLPEGRRKRGGRELGWEVGWYDKTSPRYFCVTGQIVGGRDAIRTVDPCEFFYEFESGKWDVTQTNGNGHSDNGNGYHHATPKQSDLPKDDKWSRLKRGEWQSFYESQSEADIALVGYLAKLFRNDPVLIDQAFRVSGLMRPKWDEPRAGGTYGSITIAKIIESQGRIISSSAELLRVDMPTSVLDGRLGEIYQRRMNDAPIAYSWGPLVTIAGASPFLKYQGQAIRGNLYWCSVGDVGTGKTAIFERAIYVLGVKPLDPILLKAKYGSAEGLTADLKDVGACVRLLAPDELGHLLRKCAIEHSSFPTFLTTAFYQDQQRGGTKKDAWEVDCRLSIAGGVVEDDFGDAFGLASVSGLYDRFLFGLAPQPFEYNYYPLEGNAESISVVPPKVDGDVWEVRNEWRKSGVSGRVAENCLRVAFVCAAVDGRKVLRGYDLGPAQELANYQMKVRDILKPNPGKTPDAQSAIAVMNWLREHAPNGEFVRIRDLSRGIHSNRLGPGVFHRCLQNLQLCDDVELDLKRKLVRLLDDAVTGGDTL